MYLMEQGWDPEVTRFFRKIVNTISMGLIWLLTAFTAGFYFNLANPARRPLYAVVIFYTIVVITFILLIRYFFKVWKRKT